MTILELMVASGIGLLIVAMTLSATLASRNAYNLDIVRTRLNQNLRGAFDIINMELRQAGERLPSSFPAIEIIDGASGASDTLILRRNVLDEVLTVCQNINTTGSQNIYLNSTATGTPPACVYGTQSANYTAWKNYRNSFSTHKSQAYVYDLSSKFGQFFTYDNENDNGSNSMSIRSTSSSWAHPYLALSSSIYILSEWKFKMSQTSGQTDLLQVFTDGDTTTPQNVVYGVENIQFRALMQDGTTKTSFTSSDSWTLLRAIEVTLTGSDTYRGQTVRTTLTTQLFPRNILSN